MFERERGSRVLMVWKIMNSNMNSKCLKFLLKAKEFVTTLKLLRQTVLCRDKNLSFQG